MVKKIYKNNYKLNQYFGGIGANEEAIY